MLILALATLAALSVLASEMPPSMAWPLAVAAMVHGVVLATKEVRRAPVAIVWNGYADVVTIDGVPVAEPQLHWRGPLAFLNWRTPDGATARLSWWPDTLPAAVRRELRLAAGLVPASRSTAPMAP